MPAAIEISAVRDLLLGRKLVVFAGAGLSVEPPSYNPEWAVFRSMMFAALLRSARQHAVLDASQIAAFKSCLITNFQSDAERYFKPEVFMELLRERLGDRVLDVLGVLTIGTFNANHRFLARAAKRGLVDIILTTNFDNHIEEALAAEGVDHQVFSDRSDFLHLVGVEQKAHKVSLLKLHGTLERPDTIRMTLTEAGRPLELWKSSGLQSILSQNIVLFYGYSANDDDIHPVLKGASTSAAGIIWCLWSPRSLTPEVGALLDAFGDRARVLHQQQTSLFRALAPAIGLKATDDPPKKTAGPATDRDAKETAQRILDEWASDLSPAEILHVLALSARSLANYDLAKEAIWKELDITKAAQAWSEFARANLKLANILEMENDFNSAFDAYGQNMLITEKIGDRLGYAQAAAGMAKVQYYLGAGDKAAELLDKAAATFRELGRVHDLAGVLGDKAQFAMHQADFQSAAENYGAALKLFEQEGDFVNVSATCSNLSQALRFRGDYAGAKQLIERAIALDLRHGDFAGAGSSYGNLAFMEEDFDHLPEALVAIDKALGYLGSVGASSAFESHLEKHRNARRRIIEKIEALEQKGPSGKATLWQKIRSSFGGSSDGT